MLHIACTSLPYNVLAGLIMLEAKLACDCFHHPMGNESTPTLMGASNLVQLFVLWVL